LPIDVSADEVAKKLRAAGLNVAVDFTERKLDKKLKAAAKAGVKFVLIVGADEIQSGKFTLKNLQSGAQEKLDLKCVIHKLVNQ
jgi:histidyl-tRNA synthetase